MAENNKFEGLRRLLLFVIGIMFLVRAFVGEVSQIEFYIYLAAGIAFIIFGLVVILKNKNF